MNGSLVVDASVMVKWFIAEEEPGVAEALALLTDHARARTILAAPEHAQLEVVNVLLHRGLDADGLSDAAGRLVAARIEWARLGDLLADAAALAPAHGLTLYDAAYAALARGLDAELVTADRRLAESGACRARLL